MKRYLALAIDVAGVSITLEDVVGESDDLRQAREMVDKREPDGMCVHETGAVFDTRTGEIRDWQASSGPFGDDKWFAARSVLKG